MLSLIGDDSAARLAAHSAKYTTWECDKIFFNMSTVKASLSERPCVITYKVYLAH